MPRGSETLDENEDFQVLDQEIDSQNFPKEIKNIVTKVGEEELANSPDLSCFFGSL